MKLFLILFGLVNSFFSYSQNQNISIDNFNKDEYKSIIPKPQKVDLDYNELTRYAEKMFLKKNYRTAISLYTQAIKKNNDSGKISDRYRLASAYTFLGINDSAFIQLFRIAEKGKFSEVDFITKDYNFLKLHSDLKWERLIDIIKKNQAEKKQEN